MGMQSYKKLPKKVFYGELQVGKRFQGRQKKAHKYTLKASLKDFSIPAEPREQIALDQAKWRCIIKEGADDFEARVQTERKRKERKAIAKGSSSVVIFRIDLLYCNRQFRATIGINHQKSHQRTRTWTPYKLLNS